LSGVVATQLWHHLYLGGGLCDLPEHSPRPQVVRPFQPPAAA
jgi:asparagine synthase (glutamine-hydrolysing)